MWMKFFFTFFMWRFMKDSSQDSSGLKTEKTSQDSVSSESPISIKFHHLLIYLPSDCNQLIF